jgi:hypothetical protein
MEDVIITAVFFLMLGWFWMMIDCIAYESEDKAIWLSILVVANIAGALSYLSLRYRSNRKGIILQQTIESITQS